MTWIWKFPYCRRVCVPTFVCSITLWGLSLGAQIKVIFKYLYFYTADTFDQQLGWIWPSNLLSNEKEHTGAALANFTHSSNM